MKKLFWILTVALLAFTACDNKERPSGDPEAMAKVVKASTEGLSIISNTYYTYSDGTTGKEE